MLAEKKEIALELRPAAEPCTVRADKDATMQVLDNLLSNAIKFSPPGKPITVSVLAQGGNGNGEAATGSVEVRDAGPGLSEEDQRKLYGKFVRLTAQPTAGESSNGLGFVHREATGRGNGRGFDVPQPARRRGHLCADAQEAGSEGSESGSDKKVTT